MRIEHHYALAFRRADGTPAGQVPLEVDWEPACETLRFGLFCRHGTMLDPSVATEIAPVWHRTMGEPYVERIRVSAGATDDETVAHELSSSYFGDLVQPAVQQLVEKRLASEGETLRYHVVAFPRPRRRERPPAFVSREVTAPPACRQTSFHDLVRRSQAVDDDQPHDDELPMFVAPDVVREATALASEAGAIEVGGVLVGYLHRDPRLGRVFVEVTAQIAARADGSSTTLTFTPETWTDVRAALDLRGRDELMLGWWHSHPVKAWCEACPPERQRACPFRQGFFSTDDRLLHRTMFPRAYSVALLLSDIADLGVTYRAFGWREGCVQPRGFFVLDPGSAPPVIASRSAVPRLEHPANSESPSCQKEPMC